AADGHRRRGDHRVARPVPRAAEVLGQGAVDEFAPGGGGGRIDAAHRGTSGGTEGGGASPAGGGDGGSNCGTTPSATTEAVRNCRKRQASRGAGKSLRKW